MDFDPRRDDSSRDRDDDGRLRAEALAEVRELSQGSRGVDVLESPLRDGRGANSNTASRRYALFLQKGLAEHAARLRAALPALEAAFERAAKNPETCLRPLP